MFDTYIKIFQEVGIKVKVKDKKRQGKFRIGDLEEYCECAYTLDGSVCDGCEKWFEGRYLRIAEFTTVDGTEKCIEEIIDHYQDYEAKLKLIQYVKGQRPAQKRGRKPGYYNQ